MTRITLPHDLERPLLEEARRLGTTPESVALDCLRRLFVPQVESGPSAPDETLFDFLSGHIGKVDGTTEAWSEDCGQRFADGLEQKHQQGRS